MAEKIEFLDYEERIISQIHGVKGDGVGLRVKIEHRLILPKRAPNTQQMIIVFYCNHDMLVQLRKSAEMVFGDSDFTKSLSRFLRGGMHFMDKSEDVQLVMECRGRLQGLECCIERLREDNEELLKLDKLEQHIRDRAYYYEESITFFRNKRDAVIKDIAALKARWKVYGIIDAKLSEEPMTSREIIRILWSRLISKLVPNWMSRK